MKKIICLILLVITSVSNLNAQSTDEILKKGIELREKGDLYESLAILKQAEKQDKNNSEILYQIALTFLKKNAIVDRMAASRYLERAIKLKPENVKYLYTYGKLKNKQQYYSKAKNTFEKIILLDSTHVEAHLALAGMYSKSGLNQKGMYNDGISLNKFSKKNLNKASDLLSRAVELNPANPEALYQLGIFYLEEKKWGHMEDLFERAIKLKPDFKDAYLFLGYTYYKNRDYIKAEEAFEKAKKLMEPRELEIFESFDRIFDKKAVEDKSFWVKRNPSFLTGTNLRKLEHYARVSFANLKFGKPEKIGQIPCEIP